MSKIYFRRASLAIALAFTGIVSHAQTITTLAGTGISGWSGDGGPATVATINGPNGLCPDGAGNLYFCDGANNRIRKINAAGTISTIAGNGTAGFGGDGMPATDASVEFSNPAALTFDATGNLYIADLNNQRVRKINTAGIITTIAGTGIAGFGGDGGPATAAAFDNPISFSFDSHGNLYIADQLNHRIRMINTFGIVTTVAGTGTPGFSGDGGPAIACAFYYPNAVFVDHLDNVWMADNGNQRIRKINTAGIITTVAGDGTAGYTGDGMAATATSISWPAKIKVDIVGNLFIADNGNNRIRKVNPAGIISTITGDGTPGFTGDGGPATAGEINSPTDVAVDALGNVFIADAGNGRIRKIGAVTTLITGASNADAQLKVFPNPSNGTFVMNLVSGTNEQVHVTIMNLIGQRVKEFTTTTNKEMTVELSMPSGFYFLSATTDNGKYTAKVTVR
jgi:sugar lactone lactonase YvrE